MHVLDTTFAPVSAAPAVPRRTPRATWLVCAVLLATVASVLAGPAPAARATTAACAADVAGAPLPVCDEIVLTGSETGYARLVSAGPFGFGDVVGPGGDVEVDAAGTVGVLLTQDPPSPDGPYALYLRYPEEMAGSLPFAVFGCSPCELPAGAYRLYLITDGSPATATVRFTGGAPGTLHADVAPDPGATTELTVIEQQVPGTVQPVGSTGGTRTLTGDGFLFNAIAVFHANQASAAVGRCLYFDDPGPAELAYQPGCPSLFADAETPVFPDPKVSLDPTGQRLEGVRLLPAGTYGVGTWYAAAGTGSTAAALTIWLTF